MRILLKNIRPEPDRIVLELTAPRQVTDSKHAKVLAGLKNNLDTWMLPPGTDPFQLAATFLEILSASDGIGTASYIIAESLTKFPKGDFLRFGDKNHLKDVSRAWFKDTGVPLDVQLEIINEVFIKEYTINDLIEHVSEFPPGRYKKPLANELSFIIGNFSHAYGFTLTYAYAKALLSLRNDNIIPF